MSQQLNCAILCFCILYHELNVKYKINWLKDEAQQSDSKAYRERISVRLAIETFIDNMVQWFQSQQDLTAVLLPNIFSRDGSRNDVYSFAHQKNKGAPTTAIFKKTGVDVLNNTKEVWMPFWDRSQSWVSPTQKNEATWAPAA